MPHVMGTIWPFFLPLLAWAKAQTCNLPTPPTPPIFNVSEATAPGSRILVLSYEPQNANIELSSVGGALGAIYKTRFNITAQNGQLELTNVLPLFLPPYPEIISPAYLPIEILCNGQRYPIAIIRVTNINDFAPWFYGVPYRITVPESTPVGSKLDTPIMAIDWDPASYYTVTIDIVGGNEDGVFELEEVPGAVHNPDLLPDEFVGSWTSDQLPRLLRLKLHKALDYDYGTRRFWLNISASDNGGADNLAARHNFTTLEVQVLDSDDRAPVFTASTYRGAVLLSAPAGTPVSLDPKIRAVDGDPALQVAILYYFVQENEFFDLNETTGAIILNKSLPSDLSQLSFDLMVRAVQSDASDRSSTALVKIEVVPSNSHHPVFRPCSYNASVPENPIVGTQVLQLKAFDPDLGDLGRFAFELLNSTDTAAFSLSEAGLLTVADSAPLDRERQSVFKMQARVSPFIGSEGTETPPIGCQVADIRVSLLDENDNAPRFSQDSYEFLLADTAEKNTVVGYVEAIDDDSGENGRVTYSSIEQDPTSVGQEGAVTFHGELQSNGSLKIIATYEVVGRPKFQPTYQLRVEAADNDPFAPRSARAKIKVIVLFTDSHVPQFTESVYETTVAENLDSGTRVVQVTASDPDEGHGGAFSYILNDPSDAFIIDSHNGWISVRAPELLDRELTEGFVMTVTTDQGNGTAAEGSQAKVIVSLADVNDNGPVFVFENGTNTDEYEFYIDGDTQVDTFVGRVTAHDADVGDSGRVSYVAVAVPEYFALSEEDGTITLAKLLPPRSEASYVMVVEAHDMPQNELDQRRAVAKVRIHIGQQSAHVPVFANLPTSIAISESFPVASLVFTLTVSDVDLSQLEFSIVSGDNGSFTVQDNVVYVAAPLDAETTLGYRLVIQVKSGELYSNSTLDVEIEDANDNPPLFEQQQYDVYLKSVTAGDLIGQVAASDADISEPNNLIDYEMERAAIGLFQIDQLTGELFVGELLRIENFAKYSFSVTARDRGTPPLRSFAFITVHMDGQTAVPTFTQEQYGAEIVENSDPGPVVQLVATHPTGTVVYSTESDDFTIDSQSGVLSIKSSPDYESQSLYELRVSGCITEGGKNYCTRVPVRVVVRDANDHAPVFERKSYNVRIPMDMAVDSEVIQVRATDADSGPLGELSYTLRTPTGLFQIDYETGVIYLAARLSSAEVYNLTVEAFDHGSPTERGLSYVLITVNGSNPQAPEFEHFMYEVSLPEDVGVGTLVMDLIAVDSDPDLEGKLIYKFAADEQTQSQKDAFLLDPSTGRLETAVVLDYDAKSSYQLVIEATDSSPVFPRTGSTVVKIMLTDVNDNAPVFQPLPNTIYLSTTRPPGSVIVHIHASDADGAGANSAISLKLLPENSEYFEITDDQLMVKQQLVEGRFPLQLIASDNGDPVQAAIHDMELIVMADKDKYPVFPQLSYVLTLPRNATLPKLLHTFDANVRKGEVEFGFLLPRDPIDGLELDELTGELTATNDFGKLAKTTDSVFFVIRAVNTGYIGLFSDVMVELKIVESDGPDIPLLFSAPLFRTVVTENIPIGSTLNFTVEVVDAPRFGSKLHYWLSPNDTFGINGGGQIYTKKEIDLESMQEDSNGVYELLVYASSGATTTHSSLQIKIEDKNEFAPHFDNVVYTARITEDITPGKVLLTVSATDDDFTDKTKLRYQFKKTELNHERYLSIDSAGVITKSDEFPFDREEMDSMVVTVQAIDGEGKTAEAEIEIDILDTNDNPPVFLQMPFIWNVTEGPAGLEQTFKISAADNDTGENGQVEFKIIQGNGLGLFLLRNTDRNTAEISVIRELDRETRNVRILTVEARDLGNPSLFAVATVEVIIRDTNDNPPRFHRNLYQQEVPADFPTGFSIMSVFAEDEDMKSEIQYSIEDDSSGLFEVDKTSGMIKLKKTPPKRNATYTFAIKAHDGEFQDKSNVSISIYVAKNETDTNGEKVTNQPPVFKDSSYNFSITEGKADARIGRVEAEDPDNPNAYLDLWIEPPEYRQYFRINNGTGQLYTRKPLDYSFRSSYNFLVIASDDGEPALTAFAQVKVNVEDINDNYPEFDKPDYSAIIPPNAKPPFPLPLGIDATDSDSDINSKIRYSIDGEDVSCFEIDPQTAQVVLQCSPNFAKRNMYHIEVVATDQDGAGHSTRANVTLIVSPPTDTTPVIPPPPRTTPSTRTTSTSARTNTKTTPTPSTRASCRPRFSKTKEELSLLDTTPVMAPVYVAVAKVHNSVECQLQFELAGPAKHYFELGSDNGMLKLMKELSIDRMEVEGLFERQLGTHTFQLSIRAEASSTQEVAELILVVRVVRRDDGGLELRFGKPVYEFSIEEKQPPLSVVGRVRAAANQTQSPIVYTVLFNELFKASEDTPGQIENTQTLDGDGSNPKQYSFVVQASDGENSDYASIMVSLIDLNDHAPEFRDPSYSVVIPEGPYGSGAVVGRNIQARDEDSGQNALLTYSLIDAQGYPFQIEPRTGILRVFGTIDREMHEFYSFSIMATDGGHPPQSAQVPVNVTILDVNDNSPEFLNTPMTVSVREKEHSQVLGHVKAIDRDSGENSRVIYQLANHNDLFHVSSEDGELKTTKPIILADAEQYMLQIVAKDLGRPPRYALANVTVEVIPEGQDRPAFKQDVHYVEVLPSAPPGHTILQLTAGVGPLKYSLDDDISGLFAIEETTGMVTLNRVPTYDETGIGQSLTVRATNTTSGDEATTTMRIYLVSEDTDSIFPRDQYSVNIVENTPGRTLLIDLNSTYEVRNRAVTYRFSTNDYPDLFEIEPDTGELFAIQALDRETRSVYFLHIKAGPKSKPKRQLTVNVVGLNELTEVDSDEVLVTIHVDDENDSAPEFQEGPFGIIFTVRPDAKAGSQIGVVKAKDADANSWTRLSIADGDDSDWFSIDDTGGEVVGAKNFMSSDRDSFKFTVVATDGVHTSRQLVKVYKLTEAYQAILVSKLKPKEINVYQLWMLERKLSQLTGWNVTVNGISQHTQDGALYPNMTDIRVYAVNPSTGKPIEGDELATNLQKVFTQLQQELVVLRLTEVTRPVIVDPPPLFSTAEIILIVIAIAIIAAAFIGLCLLVRIWLCKKPEENEKETASDYMVDSVSSGPRPYDTLTLDRKTANTLLVPQRGPFANTGKSVISRMEKAAAPNNVAAYPDAETAYAGSSGSSGGSMASRQYPYYDDNYDRFASAFPQRHPYPHAAIPMYSTMQRGYNR